MNAFLVMFRCFLTDYPVSIHPSKESAMVRVEQIYSEPETTLERISKLVCGHTTNPSSLGVAEYQNGELVKHDTLLTFPVDEHDIGVCD